MHVYVDLLCSTVIRLIQLPRNCRSLGTTTREEKAKLLITTTTTTTMIAVTVLIFLICREPLAILFRRFKCMMRTMSVMRTMILEQNIKLLTDGIEEEDEEESSITY